MAKTLLRIAQDVARRGKFAAISQVVGNEADQTVSSVKAAILATGEALLEKDWELVIREHSFVTVNGQANYPLPTDFKRVISKTVWDKANFDQMRGSMTPSQWQAVRNSALGSAPFPRMFRIKRTDNAKDFNIEPVPTVDGDSVVFEYGTKNWILSGATLFDDFQADTDTTLFPDRLMVLGALARLLDDTGFESAHIWDEFDDAFEHELASDVPAQAIDVTGLAGSPRFIGPDNIPDTGFGS